MGTWTIRYTETTGEPADLAPMSETGAKALLDGVRRHVDPDAVLVDLAAEIAARLPVGSRVRHTVRGWGGTVVEDDPRHAPFPRIPAAGPVAYVMTGRYTAVCVHFDHRECPEWFDAAFITIENGEPQ